MLFTLLEDDVVTLSSLAFIDFEKLSVMIIARPVPFSQEHGK